MCTLKHVSISLTSFGLSFVSLDESEQPLDRPGVDNRKFRFRGVLRVAEPDWLSDFGVKIVEAELNERLAELCMGSRIRESITLEDLFRAKVLDSHKTSNENNEENGLYLSLRIQGERGLPAVFMGCKYYILCDIYFDIVFYSPSSTPWAPMELQRPVGIQTSPKWLTSLLPSNRQYEVLTMDVSTYSRSENFFWRYRLLALMEKIVHGLHFPVPLSKRDPHWFVEKYMERFAYPQKDIHRRLIYDPNDPDLDEDGETIQTPRQLLHVHKSDILSLFAAHAEWFLTNEAARRRSIIDIKVWDSFCKLVRKERQEAARNGIRWGWPVGEEPCMDHLSSSASNEEDEVDIVERYPVTGKSNDIIRRKLERTRKKHIVMDVLEETSSDSTSEVEGHEYADEFSDETDAEWEPKGIGAVDPSIIHAIPWQLQTPPDLPSADGRWQCPMQNCQCEIDLRNITEEMGRGVEEETITYIMRKHWTNVYMDKNVLRGWRQMIHKHYEKHLVEVGLRYVIREGEVNTIPRATGR